MQAEGQPGYTYLSTQGMTGSLGGQQLLQYLGRSQKPWNISFTDRNTCCNSLKTDIMRGSQDPGVTFTVKPCQSEHIAHSNLSKKREKEKLRHNLLLGNRKLALLHFVSDLVEHFCIAERKTSCPKKKSEKERGLHFVWGRWLLQCREAVPVYTVTTLGQGFL